MLARAFIGNVSYMHLFTFLCTFLEYANERKLQQDHPCVINLIRNDFLRLPAYQNASYNLDRPTKVDPSSGQSLAILRLLRNQV